MLKTKQCSYRIVILYVFLIIGVRSQSVDDNSVTQSSNEETTVIVGNSTVGDGTTAEGTGSPAGGDTTGVEQSTEKTATEEVNTDKNDTSTENGNKNDTSTENGNKNDTSTENGNKNDTSTENGNKNDTSTENGNNDNTTTEGYLASNETTTENSAESSTEDGDDTDDPNQPNEEDRPEAKDPTGENKHVAIPILDDEGAYDFNSSDTWLKETRGLNFGGITAYANQFPFIVVITNRKMAVFTGTLLTNRWIITSAYHFIGDHQKRLNRTTEFTQNGWVFVGGKALSLIRGLPKNSTQDNRKIEEIVIRDNNTLLVEPSSNGTHHLNYISSTRLHHIALVRTETPFELDSHVFPAPIGTGIFPDSTVCYIAAYTDYRYPQAKWAVHWKRVEVFNRPTCIRRFKVAVQRLNVCSPGQRGRLACTADIGSPIMCGGKLVAIVTVRVAGNNLYGEHRDYSSGCKEAAYFVNLYELVGPQFDWLLEHVLDLEDPVPVDFRSAAVGPLNIGANEPPEFEDYRYVSSFAVTEPTPYLVGVVFLLRSAR